MNRAAGENERSLRTEFDHLCRNQYRALSALVRRSLGRRLRQRLDSEDVLQEVLLEASRIYCRGPRRPRRSEDFVRWMARIITFKVRKLARFHLQTRKRQADREVRLDSRDGGAAGSRTPRTPSSILLEGERGRLLHEAIEQLPPRQKEAVTLVHLRRLPVKEAAAILGKTPNATSVLLFEALERLGEILKRKGF